MTYKTSIVIPQFGPEYDHHKLRRLGEELERFAKSIGEGRGPTTIDWGNITNKPDFTTNWNDIIGKPACFTPCEHVHTFVSLSDTPAAYGGQGGKYVRVNGPENALEFADVDSAKTFLQLTDTPGSYEGHASKFVTVNETETGLEFSLVDFDLGLNDNLDQLSRLECCGIIVRQCATDPVYDWDTAYNPTKLADIDTWVGVSADYEGRGAGREGAVIKEVSADFKSGNNVNNYLVGSDPFFDWKSRTYDPDTGAQLSTDGGAATLPFNSNGWLFRPLVRGGSLYRLQAQGAGSGVGVARWYINGTMGPAIQSFFQVSGVYDGYHCAGDGFALYVEGVGVYSGGRGETAISRAIHFWPAATNDTMPPGPATAGALIDTGIPSGGIYLYDSDDDGNIYGIRTLATAGHYRVFSYTGDLTTERWSFDITGPLVSTYALNPITFRIMGQGRYLLHQPTGVGPDPAVVYVYDISSGTGPVLLGSFETLIPDFQSALQNAKPLSPCEIAVGNQVEIWEVCQGLIVVDPGLSASFECTSIQSGNEHITITNGDAQAGPPTVTLNDLPISKITGLQAALDAKEDDLGNPAADGYLLSSTVAGTRSWVPPPESGGFLPMTTGEVPPVLVYGPDGSLIYFEV